MINSLVWATRVVSTLFSASYSMLKEDPQGFMEKVLERLRQSRSTALSLVGSYPLTKHETTGWLQRLVSEGHWSQLAQLDRTELAELSRSERHLVSRTLEKWQLLHVPIETAEPKARRKPETLRVGFFLTNSLPHTQSGYTFRTQRTLSALQRLGIEVNAATRLGYPVLVGRIPRDQKDNVEGIPYQRLVPFGYPHSLKSRLQMSRMQLLEWAQENQIDLLHTTTDFNNAQVVSWVAKELGIPWVYEVRGELENTWLSRQPENRQEDLSKSDFYRAARLQEEASMNAADAVVALSNVSKNNLIKRGIEASKIRVMRNATEESLCGMQFSQSEIRESLKLGQRPIVGSVSSIVGYEGFDDLLKAASLVDDCDVLLVGEGSDVPRLKKLAGELGIQDRVTFAGRQPNDEIWRWYAAIDVFVVPRKDTEVCRNVTPVKALAAQALGVPIIASDLPALREITGGVAQYISPEDPNALAEAIRSCLDSALTAEEGQAWAAQNTWERNAERYIEMYQDLLSAK